MFISSYFHLNPAHPAQNASTSKIIYERHQSSQRTSKMSSAPKSTSNTLTRPQPKQVATNAPSTSYETQRQPEIVTLKPFDAPGPRYNPSCPSVRYAKTAKGFKTPADASTIVRSIPRDDAGLGGDCGPNATALRASLYGEM